VFFLMGPLLFGGAFYAAAGTATAAAVWPALACGCMVSAILLVNNLRDLQIDSTAGFTTLPMRIGLLPGKRLYALLFIIAFIIPPILFSSGMFKSSVLLPMLSLPAAARQVRAVLRANNLSVELADAPQKTAKLYLFFGLLLAIGLFISG
jgi:1,4-dihydroxy-2-naphthoate octaprenyltransferase